MTSPLNTPSALEAEPPSDPGSPAPNLAELSAVSFQKLAADIRAQALAIEEKNNSRKPLSDDDWRALCFSTPQFDIAEAMPRPMINGLSGSMAVDCAYRVMLGRAPDAEGLSSGETSLSQGMPPLLFAGILLTSAEGRARPYSEPGFKLYVILAILYRLASRVARVSRLPATKPVVWFARLASAIHSRWDANKLAKWQSRSLLKTLASWHPMLERQAGQLGAAQLAVSNLERRLVDLTQELAVAQARMNAGVRVPASTPSTVSSIPSPSVITPAVLDAYYLAFEDAHRASSRDMQKAFEAYRPTLESLLVKQKDALGCEVQAVDLGCGRGEWLEFITGMGFTAKGVDLSPVMIARCQHKGLKAELTDALGFLKSMPSNSVQLVTAFHLAEHLKFEVLFEMVSEVWRVLAANGVFILETPNPENPLVGSHHFYHDPTHRNPLTPSATKFLLHYIGFKQVDTLRLNPYPDSARVPGTDLLTERINGLLCSAQDFALVGRRP